MKRWEGKEIHWPSSFWSCSFLGTFANRDVLLRAHTANMDLSSVSFLILILSFMLPLFWNSFCGTRPQLLLLFVPLFLSLSSILLFIPMQSSCLPLNCTIFSDSLYWDCNKFIKLPMIKIKEEKKTCDQSNVYELEMSFIARNRVYSEHRSQ